jgi:serine/threonine-protein kinase
VSDTLLAGRYELGERLGVGGMSTVLLAFDRRLERHVAVKLLAEHLAEDPTFVSRFRREALAAARLVHPNIVQVFDFGLDEASGRHYIVMEYIRGRSGAQLLRDQGRLTVEETLPLVDGACRGLHYAHRGGVVHRDVKPGNLLRSEDGQVKLADFGIAKAADGSSITQVGSVLGTAAYLAPEQAHGEPATPQSDLYGLGVVTYQFLSGRLPYDASSLTELALLQQRERPPRLDELDWTIPPALADVVERALALEPGDRFASAEELRLAAEAAVSGVSAPGADDATRVVAPPTAATRAVRTTPPPSRRLAPRAPARVPAGVAPEPLATPPGGVDPGRPAPRRRRTGRLLGLLAALVLLGGAGAGAYALTQDQGRAVQVREVTGDTVDEVVDQLDRLIQDNVR